MKQYGGRNDKTQPTKTDGMTNFLYIFFYLDNIKKNKKSKSKRGQAGDEVGRRRTPPQSKTARGHEILQTSYRYPTKQRISIGAS